MTREETILANHLVDLSRQAFQRGFAVFSDFLNLNEQNIFHSSIPRLYGSFEMSGGYEFAERQMIAFLPDALMFPLQYPFVCQSIRPLNRKFADALTHRDVLGALMSLGIERGRIGDILVREQQIYIFCHTCVAAYIREELTQIKHTSVSVSIEEEDCPDIRPNTRLCEGIVSSNRLDALLAEWCRLSRSKAGELVKRGSVFVNGKEMESVSYSCKPGEVISVRGIGRFRFLQSFGETKKGRLKIRYEIYE